MKKLFSDKKFVQMVFMIMAAILIIGFITMISRFGNETLTDYAEKHPETAYAQTENSWKNEYKKTGG